MSQSRYIFRRWRLFFIYCAFLYASLPFAPRLWDKIVASIGKVALILPFLSLIVVGVLIIFKIFLLKKRYALLGAFMICAACAIFFVILRNLEFPAEKIHVIEYGLLAAIIYRSINKKQSLKAVYFKIFVIGFTVGFFDEIIQLFLPNRVFDVNDIFLNGSSVLLGQILVYSIKDMP